MAFEWVLKETGLGSRHPDGFKDIPVWIVSFEGLNYHTSNGYCRGRSLCPPSPVTWNPPGGLWFVARIQGGHGDVSLRRCCGAP